jgi:hypothetical protein
LLVFLLDHVQLNSEHVLKENKSNAVSSEVSMHTYEVRAPLAYADALRVQPTEQKVHSVSQITLSNFRLAPSKRFVMSIFIRLLNFFSYLYLLRFPILTALIVLVLSLFSMGGGAKMLAGGFDQTSGDQVLALTLVDALFLYTVFVCGDMVLAHAGLRGSAHKIPEEKKKLYRRVWIVFCWLVPLFVLVPAYHFSAMQPWYFILWAFGGAVLGAAIITLIHLLRRFIVPPGHEPFEESFPLFLPRRIVEATDKSARFQWASDAITGFLGKMPKHITDGYLEVSEHPDASGERKKRLLPGHGLVMWAAVGFSIVYLIVGISHWGTAIVYILLLLAVLCWIISTMAFFLDRFRVPILLALGVIFILAAQSRKSDHYFALFRPPEGYYGTTSSEYVLAERPRAQSRPIIVVSANGGGIQSAAWTAQVLSGLAEKFQEAGDENLRKFLESIRLISGVSGGSVGTMFFVNEIQRPGSPREMKFENVVAEAEDSGLEEVVWGMAYPDLFHAFLPWVRSDLFLDRGHALERSWIRSARKHGSPSLKKGLLKWRRGVIEGWRPATIFNSTFVETGERLQISTCPVDDTGPSKARREFFNLYNADIHVATAARLSASYPYVSPPARPGFTRGSGLFPKCRDYYGWVHAVDGGYFDNSGLCALTEWLGEALSERELAWKKARKPPINNERILVLEIRGFPKQAVKPPKPSRGWFYELEAPVSTMLGVQASAQEGANHIQFNWMKKYWGLKGIEIDDIVLQPDKEVYEKKGILPLSWHLRDQDKELIEKAWERKCATSCQAVMDFVGSP